MSSEIIKRDQNSVTVLSGITDDASQEIRMLRVDPTTNRLLISATGGGSGTPGGLTTQVQYNLAGVFAGDASFTYVNKALILGNAALDPVPTHTYSKMSIIGGPAVGSGSDLLNVGNSVDGWVELAVGASSTELGLISGNDENIAVKDSWPNGGFTYGAGALKIAYGGSGQVSIPSTASAALKVGNGSIGSFQLGDGVMTKQSFNYYKLDTGLRLVAGGLALGPSAPIIDNYSITSDANILIQSAFASAVEIDSTVINIGDVSALNNNYLISFSDGASTLTTSAGLNVGIGKTPTTPLDVNGITTTAGLNSTSDVTLTTKVTKYNNITTVSNGIPSELAAVNPTGLAAAKTTTTLYTPTASGMFRINISLQVTRAATTSSILGGTTGVVITYTEPDGSVAQSIVPLLTNQAGAVVVPASGNTGNSTTTQSQGVAIIYAKTGVAIQYAIGYTSVGATTMTYSAHLICEAL